MGRNTTHHNHRLLGGLTVAAVLGLAACGGDDDDDAAASATAAEAPAATMSAHDFDAERVATGDDAEFGVVADAPGGSETTVQVGQQLAIEAHATMQTDDVRAAVDRITTAVATRGGLVASADIDYAAPAEHDDATTERATLVLSIPPNELGDVRGVLDDVGDVLSFDQLAEDVAEQLADLDTRIANQRASVERVRDLFATAVDVDAVVRIEAELTNREIVLEQLLASQQSLNGRVAMSTMTVDIATTPDAIEVADDDDPGLADALSGGWSAFAGGVFAIVLALTAAMPFVLTALIIAVVALVVRSRVVTRPLSSGRSEPEPLRGDESEPLQGDVASHPG